MTHSKADGGVVRSSRPVDVGVDAEETPWACFYPSSVGSDMVVDHPSMLAAWERQVRSRPEAASVHYFDHTLSVGQIDAMAGALATTLAENGIVHGERIAIYLQNDPQWLITLLAAWKLGAIPVAVNPMLRAAELKQILEDSGAAAIVCLDSLHGIVDEVRGESGLRVVITTHPLDATSGARIPRVFERTMEPPRACPDSIRWTRAVEAEPFIRAEGAQQDVACLTYTSGTTGRSKGAINTHSAVLHNATVYSRWWDLTPTEDVALVLAPLFHITGLVAGLGVHIVSGAPIVLMHRFDAEETLRAIDRHRATFMTGASTAFIALSTHPALAGIDVSSLVKTPSGGATVAQSLVDRVHAATGWILRGAYGMTETASPTHLGPPDIDPPVDPDSGALSVGIPVPGARIRIVDPSTGAPLPPGEVGEIVVAGPMVIPGYWGLPRETAHSIRDGWLHTGDVGKVTADGWLFMIDRIKDLINTGGYKVVPRDVEDVLYAHPDVREASVVGVPDAYRGEAVRAYVSLMPGSTVTPDALRAFCRERMAAYRCPRSVVVLDELPKNANGKLLRRELRDLRER